MIVVTRMKTSICSFIAFPSRDEVTLLKGVHRNVASARPYSTVMNERLRKKYAEAFLDLHLILSEIRPFSF